MWGFTDVSFIAVLSFHTFLMLQRLYYQIWVEIGSVRYFELLLSGKFQFSVCEINDSFTISGIKTWQSIFGKIKVWKKLALVLNYL